jgi:hypothetical protein
MPSIKWLSPVLLSFFVGLAVTASPYAQSTKQARGDTDGDGIPDAAEKLLRTDSKLADTDGDGMNDKEDPKPLEVADPIAEGGKAGGPIIVSVRVEDNIDPKTRKDVPDHLEIAIRNPSSTDIQGLRVFFTVKEDKAGATESYFRNLTGFSIKAGSTRVLHFDSKGSPDFSAATERFRANENSVLYISPNAKAVMVKIAAEGYAPSTATVQKDPGTETPD